MKTLNLRNNLLIIAIKTKFKNSYKYSKMSENSVQKIRKKTSKKMNGL